VKGRGAREENETRGLDAAANAGQFAAQPSITLPMKITEIAFTGYAVTDMKRARAFYEGVLGLKKSRGFGEKPEEEQWVEYDIGPGCLALIVGGKD